jgi:hypothetical protein
MNSMLAKKPRARKVSMYTKAVNKMVLTCIKPRANPALAAKATKATASPYKRSFSIT